VATFLVAFGTTLSAFWILALNSWMQTPAGHEIINGEFHVRAGWAVIFNPSFPYRLTHVLLASALTVAFLLAGCRPGSCSRARPASARRCCAPG
jgi:cytochrome d ubiquinol oxidase subunit I